MRDTYELEMLVIGNILNDRRHLSSIAIFPEYFQDQTCRKIYDYVKENKEYNLYDMCYELDINFELCTQVSTCIADTATFQYRVIKLRDFYSIRGNIINELKSAIEALTTVDPVYVAETLQHNLGRILAKRGISEISD